MVGHVLFREGDTRPLTIAAAEAVADGPGWRLRFREVASRDGADGLRGAYLEASVRPDEDLARGAYYWHEVIGCAVRGVDGAELGTVKDIYRVGETEVFAVTGGSVDRLRPARGPGVHPHLRAATRRDRRRRRVARPAAEEGASTRTDRRRPDGARGAATATATTAARTRRPRPTPTPSNHDPRDRRPDAVPGDVRRAARGEHPGPDPGTGPRDDPHPRPARVGPRPPPLGRRRARTAGERG